MMVLGFIFGISLARHLCKKIDQDLLDTANILPYERVLVANVTNGTRHETYAVAAERGSGDVCVMGAAAHLVNTNDIVIIMAFAQLKESEATNHKPTVIIVDENNKPSAV